MLCLSNDPLGLQRCYSRSSKTIALSCSHSWSTISPDMTRTVLGLLTEICYSRAACRLLTLSKTRSSHSRSPWPYSQFGEQVWLAMGTIMIRPNCEERTKTQRNWIGRYSEHEYSDRLDNHHSLINWPLTWLIDSPSLINRPPHHNKLVPPAHLKTLNL